MTNKKIAINAQVNPSTAGGVETNIKSLIRSLGTAPGGLSYDLLAHPQFHEALRAIAPEQFGVVKWEFGQDAIPRPLSVQRLAWLRGSSRRAELFDAAIRYYRHVRWKTPLPASRREIDGVLKSRGVGAVHFTNPHFFDTSLPFIFEPWDLQYKHYPEFFDAKELEWRERNWRVGCHRARMVMVATEWVKRDIVDKLKVPASKIAVIPRNSHLVREPMDAATARTLLNDAHVPKKFIFYPAMTFPHKNHQRLLRALAILRDRDGLEIPLVMSGRRYKPHWPAVAQEIEALGLKQQVVTLGAVSEELLTALFVGGYFMVFPSLFEGLGLPILEAFEHGMPVLAARETCIPEVAGPGALLFDGKDEEDIARAIRHAWTHPEELEALRVAGRSRLGRFSWDKAVCSTTACYKAVLGLPLEGAELAAFQEAVGEERPQLALAG